MVAGTIHPSKQAAEIVLDHVPVGPMYIYIIYYNNMCLCAPQCLSTHCTGGT